MWLKSEHGFVQPLTVHLISSFPNDARAGVAIGKRIVEAAA
jgi:hypothetical protein